MRQLTGIAIALTLSAGAALAHPPPELADFVGARAGQAEGGLGNRGYVNVNTSYWWSATEGVCVHMPVSQGRFKSVDIVKPADCGMRMKSRPEAGAGCPSNASEAERRSLPGCQSQ
ncbi:hypothetical protein [Paracoccus ravus]|uniref:hypothetical protein n=1 Tax=Paracoccus ravus TaxID=2447760 RepID=UPI001ADC58D1|nr:hypothetical protein [Paracoccus ravus]